MLRSGRRRGDGFHVLRDLQEPDEPRNRGGGGLFGVEQGVFGVGAEHSAAAGDGRVVETREEEDPRESGASF